MNGFLYAWERSVKVFCIFFKRDPQKNRQHPVQRQIHVLFMHRAAWLLVLLHIIPCDRKHRGIKIRAAQYIENVFSSRLCNRHVAKKLYIFINKSVIFVYLGHPSHSQKLNISTSASLTLKTHTGKHLSPIS